METQTAKTNAKPNLFKRAAAINTEIFSFEKPEQSLFIEVKDQGTENTKNHGDLEFISGVNLETGEEIKMWVDGGLRGATHKLGGAKGLVGKSVEIKFMGQKPHTLDDGEKVKVNTYKVWELEKTT